MNAPIDREPDHEPGSHDRPAVHTGAPASGGDAAGRPPLPTWLKVILGILALIGGIALLLAAACFGMIAMQ